MFYSLRTVCYTGLLKQIYFAFINSKIEYALEIWGGSYITTLKPIITLQKHFMRIITFKNKIENSAPIFRNLNVLPIKNLYIFKVLKAFFNQSSNFYNANSHYSQRRINVQVPRPNLTLFKKFYLFLGPTFFNCLPEYLKKCKIKNAFVKNLRSFLMME